MSACGSLLPTAGRRRSTLAAVWLHPALAADRTRRRSARFPSPDVIIRVLDNVATARLLPAPLPAKVALAHARRCCVSRAATSALAHALVCPHRPTLLSRRRLCVVVGLVVAVGSLQNRALSIVGGNQKLPVSVRTAPLASAHATNAATAKSASLHTARTNCANCRDIQSTKQNSAKTTTLVDTVRTRHDGERV